jgi:hypothetical protein
VTPAAASNPAVRTRRTPWRAATRYFLIVFGVGFVLGVLRVTLLVPRLGERLAELSEMPVMFVAIYLAAGWTVRRHPAGVDGAGWFAVGLVALALMVAAELLLAVVLSGRDVGEYVASRDPVSSAVYLAMLALFAAMPWLRRRNTGAR